MWSTSSSTSDPPDPRARAGERERLQAPTSTSESSATALDLAGGIALYAHIPFCQTKCPYCDFNTYAGLGHLIPPYLSALVAEIEAWGTVLDRPAVNTVFLGGGTPSLLTPGQLRALLRAARSAFRVRTDAEVTAEANPDDVTVRRLAGFRAAGVNRVSMGVQTLDDGLLRLLGRRHTAAQAVEAFRRLRRTGYDNVSLDLMYGLPHQTMEQWRRTVQGVVELSPEHVSAYCLTLEEGTPLAARVKLGAVPDPDPDLAADMELWAEEALAEAGYRQYEISNWSRPGLESRHNLTYWHNLPYLGVGPGAHSFLGGRRFANLDAPPEYIRRVSAWGAPAPGTARTLDAVLAERQGAVAQVETVGRRLEMAETAMLGLRLNEGISIEGFRARFGQGLLEAYRPALSELEAAGLVQVAPDADGGRLRLTDRGRLLGNEVFSRVLST